MRAALDSRAKVPDVYRLEQLIWVKWNSDLGSFDEVRNQTDYKDTSVLDEDDIEDYLEGRIGVLGSGGLLGVDFGNWTSTDDEQEAVRAANTYWMSKVEPEGRRLLGGSRP